jgi:hypothetical protein
MSNIFNDLNKLVNTVQKVDKLLTEKPKRTRTKSVSLKLNNEQLGMLMEWYENSFDIVTSNSNYQKHNNLYSTIKINWLQTKN